MFMEMWVMFVFMSWRVSFPAGVRWILLVYWVPRRVTVRSSLHVSLFPHSSYESFIININKVFLHEIVIHCWLDCRCHSQQYDQTTSHCKHYGGSGRGRPRQSSASWQPLLFINKARGHSIAQRCGNIQGCPWVYIQTYFEKRGWEGGVISCRNFEIFREFFWKLLPFFCPFR